MSADNGDAIGIPPSVPRFVKQLVVAWKAVLLYPPASEIPRTNSQIAADSLAEVFAEVDTDELPLSVSKAGISWGRELLFAGQQTFSTFALELYQRNLAEIRFHQGADGPMLLTFLSAINEIQPASNAAGAIESRLWELGVTSVTVTEARVAIVDGEALNQHRVEATVAEVDDLVAGALAGGTNDLRQLMRVVAETETMRSWLRVDGEGEFNAMRATDRIVDLATAANAVPDDERLRFQQGIAAAIMSLAPEEQHEVLGGRVLSMARRDSSLAAVVRAMDLQEVCSAVLSGEPASDQDRDALAKSLRNLGIVSGSSRQQLVRAAEAAMGDAGFSAAMIGAVIEQAAPRQIIVPSEHSGAAEDESLTDAAAKIAEMLGLGEEGQMPESVLDEGERSTLGGEASRGITESDVMDSLISLIAIDPESELFSQTIAMVEDGLVLLLESGDLETAACAVESLAEARASEGLPREHVSRIDTAISRLARPSDLRALLHTVRSYPENSPEHAAAGRVLAVLGSAAIRPMLEVLADEPDMATRKALVDLLSGMASDHIPELAGHLTDPRWYFVRNVVQVLGAARQSSTLSYLQRTIRHPDARVRRETIRAVTNLPDGLATDMLIAALEDDEAQNVQISARYLGMRGSVAGAQSLATVARGEGRGNREIGPRLEAIAALTKLKSASSLPTLDGLALRRGLLSSGSQRQLAAAAERAANAIRAGGAA